MAFQDEETKLGAVIVDAPSVTDQGQKLYSYKVLEEATRRRNGGCLLDPDAFALAKGHCGAILEISIRLDGDKIEQALFLTSGPQSAIACGSVLTTMIQGLSLAEAAAIQAEDLVAALDGLPEAEEHCAELAVMTLQEAIKSRHGRTEEEGEHECW